MSLQLFGCGGYQQYAPAALNVSPRATRFEDRQLDSPALIHLLAAHGLAPTDSGWDSRQLALAALYQRPDLAEARAAMREAQAAEATAGVRPASNVEGTVGRAARTDQGKSSPWTLSFSTGLTFETGGKRSARTERARAAALAAALRAQATAWRVASGTREAVVTSLNAERALASARADTPVLQSLLGLLRSRYAEGQASRIDVARAEAELRTSSVGIIDATRNRTDARLALARSLAVPLAAVDSLLLRADAQFACATLDSVRADTLQALALRHRFDLGAALADYAVAEGDLRLAIARQYPDLTFVPGVSWDQGIARWLVSVALPAIPAARNRGPIAEAAARRAAQAARAASAQDSVLAAVDSSVAACREVGRTIAAADSLVTAAQRQVDLTRAAYRRGETGQVEAVLAELGLIRARRVRLDGIGRRAKASVALERAVGTWLTAPSVEWPELMLPAPSPGERNP